jgi:hypothetical protein
MDDLKENTRGNCSHSCGQFETRVHQFRATSQTVHGRISALRDGTQFHKDVPITFDHHRCINTLLLLKVLGHYLHDHSVLKWILKKVGVRI